MRSVVRSLVANERRARWHLG